MSKFFFVHTPIRSAHDKSGLLYLGFGCYVNISCDLERQSNLLFATLRLRDKMTYFSLDSP